MERIWWEAETEAARRSLHEFVRQAWPHVDPDPFIDGFHIEAICEHLEAVTKGDIRDLVINIPPRCSKPVYNESMVLLSSGERKRLADVEVGDLVITHRGQSRRVLAVHEQGNLPALTITTDTGRTLTAAVDHPFLTPTGWVQAQNLTVGDTLALVIPEDRLGLDRPLEEFRLAGYFIGDGCCRQYVQKSPTPQLLSSITCADPDQGEDILACAAGMGFEARKANARPLYNISGGARPWLRETGLAGTGSRTKRVPEFVFRGSNEQIAHFIGAYYACDGSLNRKNEGRHALRISFTSVNRPLLEDVQHLLLRLGVRSRIRARFNTSNFCPDGVHFYVLEFTSQDDTAKFIERVPVFGGKAARLAQWEVRRTRFDSTLLPDQIVSIESAGEVPCRCLTVEDDHSFLIEDIAVHNSLITSVLWPAWSWIDYPETRWLTSSYAQGLSTRDSVKCRRLLLSNWYQERWGSSVTLREDQNAKMRFENDRGGYRLATSVGGVGTGEGGDFLVCDDPHNVLEAESETQRAAVIEWWDGTMSSRGNNPRKFARVIIAQRVHQGDLCGHVLAAGGYEHLCLPAEYEEGHPFRRVTSIGFEDPRRREGDLLCPERFGTVQLERLKKDMTPLRAAGQLQQRPAPKEGAMFKQEWFIPYREAPAKAKRVRAWDLAASDGAKNDWTVGVKMAKDEDGIYYIEDVVRGRWTPHARDQVIMTTAEKDGSDVSVWIEEEGGSGGKAQVAAIIRQVEDKAVRGEHPTGNLVDRADPLASKFEGKNVRVLASAPWYAEFESELIHFPAGTHDDQVAAAALAQLKLSGKKTWKTF